MNFLSYFFPQTIEEINSPINGKIKVIKYFNRFSIQVDNLSQSGGLVEQLWNSGLKKIHNSKFMIHNSLILGVGGGTIIKLLNKHFPDAKITGIEIDPLMIDIARKYFQLNNSKNLKIIISDAIKWVYQNSQKSKSAKFDLIIVDLYIGQNIPTRLKDNYLLTSLNNLLSPNGVVIINHLRNKKNAIEVENFVKTLNSIFPKVIIHKPLVNYLLFCYKK